ncbi:Chromosome condensation complex Condensin, subunit G [Handroanthus impetiginosus]|uniref:Chromosome condensation complex Condensin, subunit G n=1 Tax=Handroanthus impetiginosus TaxID=429701 RepID=A0A2G9H352_9LAMI|nr:Chromosome condensation complex Condensin, subunit G [Handroanthus impetiginosus]
MATEVSEEHRKLSLKIARVFDDVRTSHAIHSRKLKELSALRSSSAPVEFCSAFCKALAPLFNFQRRTASAERIIKFASVFACSGDGNGGSSDEFLENFLRFLLVAAAAGNKTARFRACQIVSEIIIRLPDDAEVSNELWDEVIESMKLRVGDKNPTVRTFAVRALARFTNDSENGDILELFLEKLPLEQNGDVRKIIVLSMPPSSETLSMIIDCTLDVSESVRKAAYFGLASKFPLQSLSIKLRTTILQRGLADRSAAVAKECLKLMKDEWLEKCCNGDPIGLLKFLDVETYELVGESVMATLLKEGLVKLQNGQTIRKFFVSSGDSAEGGHCNHYIKLMDAEVALFWRMVCKHLHVEAQTKGSDAAMTMGTESAVYAAEASDNNDLLDSILPASVSEYVELVNAHIAAGPNYRFVSRQLLLLGAMLDFSDASNRKVASEFVQSLLHMAPDHELDDDGNEVVIGDGFNLGGERDWAAAVAELAKKVHAATGEFVEVVLTVVEELARPCRDRTADCKQWLHCLAVIALLLENTTSFRHMHGRAIDPAEILHSILLPGAKHANLDVQRASIRCLGLFGLLERKPSESIVKQLRCSFVKGPPTITIVASKALLDLGIWHGPEEMDKAMNSSLSSKLRDEKMSITAVEFCNGSEDLDIELLDLLYAGLEHDWGDFVEIEENQSIEDVLGEGLAKILLLSNKFPGSLASTHHLLLAKLVCLYFSSETEVLQRLKQCLSVFFEHYPSLSANHKKCLSKAFMPVIRSMWPGINGNVAGSSLMVSTMRKRAVQASRFMLQMMQAPLLVKETAKPDDEKSENPDVETDPSADFESGQEGLAVRIAVEVASFHAKKTAAEKSYLAALCRILVLLDFRVSEQRAIKLMRRILNRVFVSVAAEKDLTKELRQMAERLQAIDRHPDEKLSPDQANLILGRLELEFNIEEGDCMDLPPTPAPQSTRRSRPRRRARDEESSSSDDEPSPTSVVPTTTVGRSQRASKTAALTRMTAKDKLRIEEDDNGDTEDDAEEDSEVTSEDDSEPSD